MLWRAGGASGVSYRLRAEQQSAHIRPHTVSETYIYPWRLRLVSVRSPRLWGSFQRACKSSECSQRTRRVFYSESLLCLPELQPPTPPIHTHILTHKQDSCVHHVLQYNKPFEPFFPSPQFVSTRFLDLWPPALSAAPQDQLDTLLKMCWKCNNCVILKPRYALMCRQLCTVCY